MRRAWIPVALAAAAGAFVAAAGDVQATPVFTAGVDNGVPFTKPRPRAYTTIVNITGGAPATRTMGAIATGRDDESPFVSFFMTDLVGPSGALFPNPPYAFGGAPPYTLQFTYRAHLDRKEYNPTAPPAGVITGDTYETSWAGVEDVREQLEAVRATFNAATPPFPVSIQLWVDTSTATTQLGAATLGDSEFYQFQVTY